MAMTPRERRAKWMQDPKNREKDRDASLLRYYKRVKKRARLVQSSLFPTP